MLSPGFPQKPRGKPLVHIVPWFNVEEVQVGNNMSCGKKEKKNLFCALSQLFVWIFVAYLFLQDLWSAVSRNPFPTSFRSFVFLWKMLLFSFSSVSGGRLLCLNLEQKYIIVFAIPMRIYL